MKNRNVKMLTVTLAIETDSKNMDDIEEAICSELAGLEINYDCTEAEPDGTDGERVQCRARIAIAKTKHCRADAGVSPGYAHPGTGKTRAVIEGMQFVYG